MLLKKISMKNYFLFGIKSLRVLIVNTKTKERLIIVPSACLPLNPMTEE